MSGVSRSPASAPGPPASGPPPGGLGTSELLELQLVRAALEEEGCSENRTGLFWLPRWRDARSLLSSVCTWVRAGVVFDQSSCPTLHDFPPGPMTESIDSDSAGAI